MRFALALLLLLAVAGWAFLPGLTGPFLFDDTPNLAPLADHRSDTAEGAMGFVLGNNSGPGGRPLSMATFLLDGLDWPTDPYPFKRTNLLLHLLTGVVALLLARRLLAAGGITGTQQTSLALLATAVWLLHPIQTATVYLVVQRMTILCTLFTMLSLWATLGARQGLIEGRRVQLVLWTSLALLAVMLAGLSKETAAVLPLLAAVIERTIAPLPDTRNGRLIRWFGLWLPSAGLMLYVATLGDPLTYIPWRGFTPLDRFVTEGYVLLDYLGLILVPSIRASLYHDDYPLRGLATEGWISLLPWLLISVVALLAWRRNARWRWLRFGVLFYLAGHALEAAPISLELYFLHRNYLPMFGLLLGLTVSAYGLFKSLPKGHFLGAVAAVLGLLLLTTLTRISAKTWGDAGQLYNIWALESPASIRARLTSANYWVEQGDERRSLAELQGLLKHNPKVLTADVASYYIECRTGSESLAHWQDIQQKIAARGYQYDSAAVRTFELLSGEIRNGHCQKLTASEVIIALDALAETESYRGKDGEQIYAQIAFEFARLNDYSSALGAAEKSLAIQPTDSMLRLTAGLREMQGDKAGAIAALEQARDDDPRRGLGHWIIDDAPRKAEFDEWIRRLKAVDDPIPQDH